ncbi:MAG: Spheroidene monooxygenase, partial [uncultured Nocardioides sp.]
ERRGGGAARVANRTARARAGADGDRAPDAAGHPRPAVRQAARHRLGPHLHPARRRPAPLGAADHLGRPGRGRRLRGQPPGARLGLRRPGAAPGADGDALRTRAVVGRRAVQPRCPAVVRRADRRRHPRPAPGVACAVVLAGRAARRRRAHRGTRPPPRRGHRRGADRPAGHLLAVGLQPRPRRLRLPQPRPRRHRAAHRARPLVRRGALRTLRRPRGRGHLPGQDAV